jgi:hypothetical protein
VLAEELIVVVEEAGQVCDLAVEWKKSRARIHACAKDRVLIRGYLFIARTDFRVMS